MNLDDDMDDIIDLLDSFRPDYIVNFAAQSKVALRWKNSEQGFQTDAVAITELAHAVKDRNFLKRYVHVSLLEVYGTCVGNVKEDYPVNPTTPYQ